MKFIILVAVVIFLIILFRNKNKPVAGDERSVRSQSSGGSKSDSYRSDGVVKYSIKIDGFADHRKDVVDNLLVINDLYECSKADLVEGGYIDEDIPKYECKIRDIEFAPDAEIDNLLHIMIGDIFVGDVPKKNLSRVRNIIDKKDPDISWSLTNGPCKSISQEYDYDKEKYTYTVDMINAEIDAKITFKYKK